MLNTDKKETTVSLDELFKNWNGKCIITEKTEYTKSPVNNNKTDIQIVIKLILSILAILFLSFSTAKSTELSSNFRFSLLLISKITGIFLSVVLLLKTLAIDAGSFMNKLCNAGKNINCNSVLQSKGAKFLTFSWSEIGLFYFTGSFLILLLNNTETLKQILLLLSSGALFYIIYSIYYQAFILKKWCLFCLMVQALFVVEFLLLLPEYKVFSWQFSISEIIKTAFYFSLPALVWLWIKPLLLKSLRLKPYKQELNKWRRDPELFQFLPEELASNTDEQKTSIIFISNPLCNPCQMAFNQLYPLALADAENIDLQTIYAVQDNEESEHYKIALQLIAIQHETNKNEYLDILNKWYNLKNKSLTELHNLSKINSNEKHKSILKQQTEWCKQMQIAYTPTIYINNRKLPDRYTFDDIKYLIA